MSSALGDHPVTGFMSDYRFNAMNDRRPTSPQRRWETFPARTTLPSREPSKEDIELAEQLLGHSQGARNYKHKQSDGVSDSTSQRHECLSPSLTMSPSADQVQPGSISIECRQRENSQPYGPESSQSDAVPSGQVCR
jgi:GATA-binding protein, other eukaryote